MTVRHLAHDNFAPLGYKVTNAQVGEMHREFSYNADSIVARA